jgi:hypothetical protein
MENCNKCNQLIIEGMEVLTFLDKTLCSDCYIKLFEGIENKVIEMYIPYTEEITYLPIKENFEHENRYKIVSKSVEEMINNWNKNDWGYNEQVECRIVPIEVMLKANALTTEYLEELQVYQQCSEFDIICFQKLMINPKHYNTPWDESPNNMLYSSEFAVQCEQGLIYDKDFSYFECTDCGRMICEQNPANGWMVQVRTIEEYDEPVQICLSCLQKRTLKTGIPITEETKFKDISNYAMFYNHEELKNNGWEHKSSHRNEDAGTKELLELSKDYYVLIDFDRCAIGGLEVYWSIWTKEKENNEN